MKTKWFMTVAIVLVSILWVGMSVQAQTRTPQVYDLHDSLGQARFEITPTSYIYTRGGVQIVLEDKEGRWTFWVRDLVRRGIQRNYLEGWLSGEFARVLDSRKTAHIEFFLLNVPPERAIQNFFESLRRKLSTYGHEPV